MSIHSYSKIWIHIIWSTHNREKIFYGEVRKKISEYLYQYARQNKIFMKINHINSEHVHVLIDVPTNLSVEQSVKLLKGSSSHYINQKRLVNNKFSWARGYGAFSVSESNVKKVEEYIRNQDEHHKGKSFAEEYEMFLVRYRIMKTENG